MEKKGLERGNYVRCLSNSLTPKIEIGIRIFNGKDVNTKPASNKTLLIILTIDRPICILAEALKNYISNIDIGI